uniref:ATP synthase subunit a n=1 Tax=Cyriopagopus schmidti TaxID=29017 RepID=Q6JT28_CYRSC|nr:ATP synthase F0 subunit 6 [Cyriopagopus schmidti]AAP51150.1 ATP synthase F0 subunit 6 [Cyriopagopus schmidti]
MMMSLFSVFDPVSYFGISLNWVVMFFVIMMIPMSYYLVGGFTSGLWMNFSGSLSNMYKDVSFPNFSGLVMISSILFFFISIMNVIGLFPFVFTASGHVIVTLSMGLILWMMSMSMGWIKDFSKSSAHLVPEGAPLILSPFMVIIEFVSHMIRPLTLSVRLAANMMAGHLILGLIASVSLYSFSSFWMSVVAQSVMLVLEWAVCFIQAFVFSILVMLYALDYY